MKVSKIHIIIITHGFIVSLLECVDELQYGPDYQSCVTLFQFRSQGTQHISHPIRHNRLINTITIIMSIPPAFLLHVIK